MGTICAQQKRPKKKLMVYAGVYWKSVTDEKGRYRYRLCQSI